MIARAGVRRQAAALLGALAVLAALLVAGCRRPAEPAAPPSAEPAPPPPAAPAPSPAGRVAVRPDRGWVAAARAAMSDPREASCGPYRLVTDSSDGRAIALCERIGAALEEVYRERFGLEPVGEPRGVVLLFARRADFRRFALDVAGLPAGYGGFSRGSRGVVALPADDALFASTLAHELTHLVHRRALGPDLPPWLSEGLADAIGDAADERGLVELTGLDGARPQAERLAGALAGDTPPRLARLAALGRGEFDRGVRSLDYEHSALAVRMLLLEDDLAPGFRRFLAAIASGRRYDPAELTRAVGASWPELDRRLESWLARRLSPR